MSCKQLTRSATRVATISSNTAADTMCCAHLFPALCCSWQDTHEWEDPPGTDIQEYDADAAAQRLGIQPDVDYYAMLEVSRDVDAATLKRQYYMLARKWHPGDPNKKAT